jgi:hypothetical protein
VGYRLVRLRIPQLECAPLSSIIWRGVHVKIYTPYDRPTWIVFAATLNSDIGLSLFLWYTLY